MLNSNNLSSIFFLMALLLFPSCDNGAVKNSSAKTKAETISKSDAKSKSKKVCDRDTDFVSETGHKFAARSGAALTDIFKTAKAKDFEAFMKIGADPYIQHSPDMKDGWEPVWKLTTERPPGFSSKQIKWIGRNGMLDNGNFLLMLREVDRADGTPPSKIVDLMRFDSEGKYAEHWDIRQALSKKTKSGNSETGAASKFVNNPVDYAEAEEEKNKKRAVKYLNSAFNQGELPKALKEFAYPEYVQHNPMIPDGIKPLIGASESGKLSNHCYDIKYVLAQNDLVVVYSKLTEGEKINAVIDIFRIRDGKMVEHWDVVQAVPDDKEMPHSNGMF